MRFILEHSRKLALLLLLFALGTSAATAQKKPFIDWDHLSNPVLEYPDWSIKDAAMSYRQGTFYVFFSAFYQDNGQIRSHVVEVSTRDFKHFSGPIFNFDGEDNGWIGMCSPDVQKLRGKYVMTFNSWGDKPGRPNQLFYMTSDDLVHWSPRHSLAQNLTSADGGHRTIDAALAVEDGGYYLMYKDETPGLPRRTSIAFAPSLDGSFQYVGDGVASLRMADGTDTAKTHENFEFVQADGKWLLLSTNFNPLNEVLYTLKPGTHWREWEGGYRLDVPQEKFNTDNLDNASALYDWRKYDGYYYLLYAGRDEAVTYGKRGWNRLALARSKDLIHWSVPGKGKE